MADQATDDEKKKNAPKPKFGQILNLGSGKMWTVESSEGGSVTIMQREGDGMTRRNLTEEEYAAAKENPLPSEYLRSKPPKGLSIGSYVDAGRIVGYDAATGEAQIEGPKGTVWTPGKSLFGGGSGALYSDSSEGVGGGGLTDVRARSTRGDNSEQGGDFVDRAVGGFVAKNIKDLTGGLVDLKKSKKTTSAETGAPNAAPVVASPAPVPTNKPSREISEESFMEEAEKTDEAKKIEIKTTPTTAAAAATATPTVAATGKVAVTASVASAAPVAAPTAPTASAPAASVSVKATLPTIRETREQMRGAMKSVTARAKALHSAPAPSAARGGDQQQLYARAADALQVMGSRVASQRASIQQMQGEATVLRDEIAGLNTQPTADSAQKIQTASKKLGDTNNRIALSRFNLQADEARVQQLQIGTKLMRNAAPEVAAGRMPAVVVGMVEQSIPGDIPPPSPARAAAFIASMSEPSPSEPPPQNEEGAGGGVAAPRSYSMTTPTGLDRGQKPLRGTSPKRNLSLLPSTSDFLSAQQADRGRGGFIPGVGSPDAREAALGSAGATSGRPVIGTVPKSYAEDRDLSEADQAQDIFNAGVGGPSSDFAQKQRQAKETQEQFLPATTPDIEGTTFEKETERDQSVRNEPQPEDLQAAAFNAARQRARAASLSTMLSDEEESKGASSALKGLKQAESVRRNVARMFDLFNAALAVATTVTIIGALLEIGELLVSMNGRVLSAMFFRNPKSVARKFFPAAQFPYEIAAIIALDFIIFTFIFLSLCIAMLPIIILIVLVTLGVGGLAFAVSGS